MYSRVKLFLIFCFSGVLLIVVLNLNLNKQIINKYSYLNVVQQSFHYEEEDHYTTEKIENVDQILYGNQKTCKEGFQWN